MPCGGIWPAESDHPCWACGETGCDLWCEEWDTPLHKRCLGAFLKTEEGQCVIAHGHNIIQGGAGGNRRLPACENSPFRYVLTGAVVGRGASGYGAHRHG